MIQEDLEMQGRDIFEINDFVDEYNSIKKLLLDGQELYIDEDNPLLKETE